MTFPITYSSPRDYALKWLFILKGVVELSERQREVVVELVGRYLELKDKILDQEVLWTTLLSTAERKKYQVTLSMSPYQFTNILSDLRKAELLTIIQGIEQLDPRLLPQPEFHVTFHYQ